MGATVALGGQICLKQGRSPERCLAYPEECKTPLAKGGCGGGTPQRCETFGKMVQIIHLRGTPVSPSGYVPCASQVLTVTLAGTNRSCGDSVAISGFRTLAELCQIKGRVE